MSKKRPPPPCGQLLSVLDRLSLRYVAKHTGISKSRLHRLRQDPTKAKLIELIWLADAGMITLLLKATDLTTQRKRPEKSTKRVQRRR